MASYAKLTHLPKPRLGQLDVATWVNRVARLETRIPVAVLHGPELTIAADGDQLDQLLINLVRNAADAALETGGGVRVGWGSIRGADGYVEMVLTEPRMWEGLVRAMGNPAWAGDPAYATPDERSRRKFEINPRIEAWTRSLPGREVREALQANQCPAFEVRTVEELVGARQYQARGFWVDEKDGALGRARTPSTPFGGPKPHLGPAPRLGQHNAQVYRELELRAGDLRRLEAEGVI